MSRPLRIEYEGAWYHVMNRGINQRSIFLSTNHYKMFLDLLEEITRLFSVEIHAYCLMKNHYHLLMQTPRGNLARAMRRLSGVYTQRFNWSVKRDGALFRGRYKAQLVEQGAYLLQVSRYIHFNPVAAKIIEDPICYKWSSYSSYIGDYKEHEWLYVDYIMSQIKDQMLYEKYEIDDEFEKLCDKRYSPSILGNKSFKSEYLKRLDPIKVEESMPDIKRTQNTPSVEVIIESIAGYFCIKSEENFISKRGVENLPRVLSMLICRYFFGHKLGNIAFCMSGIKPTTVSANVIRSVGRLDEDIEFRKQYESLLNVVNRDLTP